MISIVVAMLLSSQAIENLPADCSHAMTTRQVDACRLAALGRETDRMTRYLAVARERAVEEDAAPRSFGEPSRQADYLDRSQAAWIAYSKIVCDGVYDHWKDGTVRTAASLGCSIEMTRERTHVIWRNYLTYADRTPPVLPEPTTPVSER